MKMVGNVCYNYEDFLRIGEVQSLKKVNVGGQDYMEAYKKNFFRGGQYEVFTKTKFIKRYVGPGRDISDVIDSDAELGKMYRLMRYIDNMNMIVFDEHNKKITVPADEDLILRLVGGHHKRAKEFLNRMIELEIIKKARLDGTRYFVNPIYTMAAKGISVFVYKLFRESLIPHLTEQAIKDLDFLCYIENNPSEFHEMKEEYDNKKQLELKEQEERMKIDVFDEMNKIYYDCVINWLRLDDIPVKITIASEYMTQDKMEVCRLAITQYIVDRDIDLLIRNSKNLLAMEKNTDSDLIIELIDTNFNLS